MFLNASLSSLKLKLKRLEASSINQSSDCNRPTSINKSSVPTYEQLQEKVKMLEEQVKMLQEKIVEKDERLNEQKALLRSKEEQARQQQETIEMLNANLQMKFAYLPVSSMNEMSITKSKAVKLVKIKKICKIE